VIIATVIGFDLNKEIFLYINNLSLYSGKWIWPILTIFGDPLIILCIGLSFIHFQAKIALAILPAMIIGIVLVFTLKWGLNIARPSLILEHGDFILLGRTPISPAFPSGHTTGIMALATLMILYSKHYIISVIILMLAFVVAISRIMVGAHWPLDIGGGMILGWGIALTTITFTQNWKYDKNKQKLLLISLLICSFLLIFKDTGYSNTYPIQVTIALYGLLIGMTKVIHK